MLKRGRYVLTLDALANGVALIRWYRAAHGGGAAKAVRRQTLIARGGHTFEHPDRGTIAVRLTRAGRRLLRGVSRVRLIARATFTGAQTVSSSATFTLRR